MLSSLNKSNYDDSDNSLGDHNHDNLNSSIGTSSSSKAVLAALRALQDKIRRLETERSQALDDINSLKHQLKQQEIENEAAKQREQLISQKNLNEIKHAYDKLLNDKNDLELHLRKYEDKSKISLQHSEELQIKVRSLEEEKHNNQMKIKDLENQRNQIESQIKLAQIKEEEMSQTLQWENKRHDENINFAHKRLQSLQDELQELSQEKGMSDAKLIELDGLVTQLLSVNESLVSQLTGKPISKSSSSSSLSKTSKKSKKMIIPKAATMSTVASDANRATKYNTSSSYHNNFNSIPYEIENLKNMHNMYANIAKTIQKAGKKTKKSTDSSNRSIDNSASTTTVSNKKNTRLSRKKAQLIDKYTEQVHENMDSFNNNTKQQRYNTTTVSNSSVINETKHTMNHSNNMMDIRIPKPVVVSFDNDYELSKLDLSGTGTGGNQVHRSSLDNNDYLDYINNRNSNNNSLRSSNNDYNTSRYHTTTTTSNTEHNDMQHVISSLEEEFDQLNTQYRRLLSNVQSSNHPSNDNNTTTTSSNISANINISKELPFTSSDTIQRQAEEIVEVIQQLHRKGEQIRALKSSP